MMANYYSQHGEDFLLDRIFEGQPTGFFVEVGCIDGIRFSNTLSLEQRGWKGMCIEAHADYIGALRRNRPGSIVEHCAAGEADEDAVTFYANFRGSLSSLDKEQEERFRGFGKYFGGFTEQKVAKSRLDTLLARHQVESIDVLSIDIEGYEVEAMRGLDISRYRPRVMVIEVDGKAQEDALDALILPHGYLKWVCFGGNLFYLSDASLADPVRNREMQAEIIRVRDDFDGTDTGRIRVTIDTRVPDGGIAGFDWTPIATQPPRRSWFNRLFGRR
jgi:FkbM family methyltransferase